MTRSPKADNISVPARVQRVIPMAPDVVTKVVGATIRNICDTGVGASRALFFCQEQYRPYFFVRSNMGGKRDRAQIIGCDKEVGKSGSLFFCRGFWLRKG